MNIVAAARADLLGRLIDIGQHGDAVALRALLGGAGLPAMGNDISPAEWIQDALESSATYHDHARPIAALLVPLVGELCKLAGRSVENPAILAAFAANLFQLASWLPQDDALFAALLAYEATPGNPANADYQLAFQLRRALAEQQPDTRLFPRWIAVLQDRSAAWTPARRTDLLETWRAMLCPLDFDADLQGVLDSLDAGLRALHDATAGHPESAGMLEVAARKLDSAHPLDPDTWVGYFAPYLANWPAALRQALTKVWPVLGGETGNPLATLPDDLAALWATMGKNDQNALRDFLQRNDTEEGQKYLANLMFTPPKLEGLEPQAVCALLKKLDEHLWPAGGKTARTVPEYVSQQKPRMEIVRTGTDNMPFEVNYEDLDEPTVMRRGRARSETGSSIGQLELPAFKRKQAD